jgi:hypothetical protein
MFYAPRPVKGDTLVVELLKKRSELQRGDIFNFYLVHQ